MAYLLLPDSEQPWYGQEGAFRSSMVHVAIKEDSSTRCSRIWDPVNAQFESCVLPYIANIPALLAICIVLGYLFRLIPGISLTPWWLSRFVREVPEPVDELTPKRRRSFTVFSGSLLLVSILGLSLQVSTALFPRFQLELLGLVASWIASIILLVILRPAATPKALLGLYVSIFVSQFIIIANGASSLDAFDCPATVVFLLAFAAIWIILCMPLRDPSLPRFAISPPFGVPTEKLRTPEDCLTLWQFMSVSWMESLLKVGNSRQLNDDDVWSLGYQFDHQTLHSKFRELKGSVFRKLIEANGLDLFILSMLGILEIVGYFSVPVLLQKLLQSMEDHHSFKRPAFVYTLLTLLIRLVVAQSENFSVWYGRRAYERSRGELITMLYEKTLSRKMVSVSSKARDEGRTTTNGKVVSKSSTMVEKLLGFFGKKGQPAETPQENSEGIENTEIMPEKSLELATTGKIMNLMRFDAYEVAQRFWEFAQLVTTPLSSIIATVLIWRLIGWPCLLGVITIFVAQGLNAWIARILLKWERRRRASTDAKLHKINQLVEAIRHLRYYGWQDVWLARVMEARQVELGLRIVAGLWQILIGLVNTLASGLFPVVSFYAYTVLAGKPLRVDIAFPALQLFSMLEHNLQDIPNQITVLLNARVSMGRIEDFMKEPDMAEAEAVHETSSDLAMHNATFAWPGATEPVLREITLLLPKGLTVVYGEVGTGKTALLQAFLGELDKLSGEYERSNNVIAYCGQTPWLQSMSIRENILFSSPYEEVRYRHALDVCALLPDMANFDHGDLSLVGENGVGLSGGQKARISLARAVYSQAKVLLLDDPLSALDHHTAESIVRKCISGPLLKDKTVVLVTHRTDLVLPIADQVVEICNGRAETIERDSLNILQKVHSHDSANEDSHVDEDKPTTIPAKFLEDEHREHGGVKASIYWEYVKAGKLRWWFILFISMLFYRLTDVSKTWFLKTWGEAYDEVEETSGGPLSGLPHPERDIKPWLVGFLVLAIAQAVADLSNRIFMLVISYQAGKNMFERVITRVTHAKFRFYDVTPVGRLMNRLTSDINTIDGNISGQLSYMANLATAWVSSVIVIGSVTPLFLIFAVLLTISFVAIFSHFLPTSQSLRRLEMVSLSPLISNFGELTTGLTSIRAFKVSYLFQQRVIKVTDNFQKMDHFYWSLQSWLMWRFDILSAISTFLLTSLALITGLSPGLTAFVLTAASKFVWSTHKMCRRYGQLQMDFVSVERVVEMMRLDQEPPGKVQPPAYWPSYDGDIIFENVTIRYAPHLEPSLTDVSLKIKGGSTTALIGRTASGKSTLALSLLATTLPSTGRIIIDGIDISTVDTQALRKRVTFLAQEPVLFPGSMRVNLDPLDEYSDSECIWVLDKIASRHQWSLDTHVDTGGRNLSQGQRQLVGLARAMLRRSPIIIMDEATASIDMETAMRIQKILREEMKDSTVITIAHRVDAVKGADHCVVLSKGRIIKSGGVDENVEELLG